MNPNFPIFIFIFTFIIITTTSSSSIYDGQPLYDTSQLLTTSDLNPLYCISDLNCQAVAGLSSRCHLGQCICNFGFKASSSSPSFLDDQKPGPKCSKVHCTTDTDCTALFSNSRCSLLDNNNCSCSWEASVDLRTQSCRYSTSCSSSSSSCFGRFGLHSECCDGQCSCKIGYHLASSGFKGSNECTKTPCTTDDQCQQFWEYSKCFLGGCECDLACQQSTNRTCSSGGSEGKNCKIF